MKAPWFKTLLATLLTIVATVPSYSEICNFFGCRPVFYQPNVWQLIAALAACLLLISIGRDLFRNLSSMSLLEHKYTYHAVSPDTSPLITYHNW